jgi:hypothetical protein
MSDASKETRVPHSGPCAAALHPPCYLRQPQLTSQDYVPFLPPAGKISKQHSCPRQGLYVFLDGIAALGEAWATAGNAVSTARESGEASQVPPASASDRSPRSADPRLGDKPADVMPSSRSAAFRRSELRTARPAAGAPR